MRQILGNWGEYLINKVLHPFTIFATPLFILLLIIYFVAGAFKESVSYGVRSFAGALFPLIIVTYIFLFQKELIASLGKIKIFVSFLISFCWGIILMLLISIFGNNKAGIPVNEIILSGSFSILVFSYVSIRENKILSFYYGMISGFLFFIIFFSFPI